MSRVLVSGLALGRRNNICNVCNVDVNWVIRNPSTFLTAEKILVPNDVWEVLQEANYPTPHIGRCIKLMFEIAKANDLVELVDTQKIISPKVAKKISQKIEQKFECSQEITQTPEQGKIDMANIIVGGEKFCQPKIWTVFASHLIAKKLQASCLLESNDLKVFESAFGSSKVHLETKHSKAFTEVFKIAFPEDFSLPHFAFQGHDKVKCSDCAHEKKCGDNYEKETEIGFINYLKYRDYDEIQEISENIKRITQKSSTLKEISPLEIQKEFEIESLKAQKRLYCVFPEVKRWANIATIVSIPLALSGMFLDVTALKLIGATVAGASQIAKETISYLDSKYQWVNFYFSRKKMKNES